VADNPSTLKRPDPAGRTSAPAIVPGPGSRVVRRRSWRLPLLTLGPVLAAAVALTIYFLGGRYVSEENSYVGANTIAVAPQVSGTVVAIAVSQNQQVEAGAPLFRIDPEPYRIAADGARAQLGITHDQIEAEIETYKSRQQQVQQAQASVTFAQQQLDRAQVLVGHGAATQQQLDTATRDQQVAARALAAAQADAAAALAQIGGDGDRPIEQRPQYVAAEARLREAERNLRLTEVTAPFAGVITNVNSIDIGAYLAAGQQAMSMVAIQNAWADSNLRETDLTYVKAGDPATVTIDTYPDHPFRGHVQTINPATGAVFALIPPQNASGNWVKVVQRVPVRVAIDRSPDDPVLRNGLSCTVTIDTGKRRTPATLWRDILSWF
jgi:membrane fusion protein (multidrug efflux system)